MKKIAYISASPNSILWFLKHELIYLSNKTQIFLCTNKSDEILLFCKQNNIKFIDVTFSRRISFYSDLISILKLINVIKKNKIEVIKSISLKAGFIANIVGIFTGVKTRYHIVAGIPWLRKNTLIKLFSYVYEMPTMWLSTHIQTDSKEQKKILNKYYGIKNKVFVINNGSISGVPDNQIDNKNALRNRKRLRKIFKFNENVKILIFIGRICKDKGINELLSAFNKISKENNSINLVLLGLFEEKFDKISNSSLEIIKSNKNVIHINHRKNVYPYIHMSDLLIIPSYGEGFGNVVIEAGACSKPVLGTKVCGLNESIIDGYNGIKVNSHSEQELIAGINTILNDNSLYKKLSKNGLMNVKNNFKQSSIINASKNKMLSIIQ